MKRSLKCAMRRWLMRLSLILLMAGILPAQAEDCPDWDAAVAYTAGQCATHAGTAYRAKWWNQGAAPDAADPWGAWEAANPPTPEPDACPAWSTSAIYTAGQCVTHAGRRYTARWWTQGETPVVSEWGAWAVQDTPVDPPPPVPTTPAGIYFIDTDHLGTPRVISDEAGKIVWRWDFGEPFGDSQPDDDPGGDGVRFDFPLRFPGQYHDRETGLNYNYYRDYDPATGRYTTSDPIGLAGGINTYSYVNGNPLSYTDPTGEIPILIPAIGLGIGLGLGGLLPAIRPSLPGKRSDDPWDGLLTLSTPAGTGSGSGIGGLGSGGGSNSGGCCNPPAGTICYFIDRVPPSKPHYPIVGSHYHLFRHNPLPDGTCRWNPIGASRTAPPKAIPCPFTRTGGR